jgi:hypothetical protein
VEEDVIDGYVSIDSACLDYGVVIDTATLRVDPEATEKLREGMKTAS